MFKNENSLTEHSNDEYFKNAVIKPPKDDLFYEGNIRNTRIVFDSKDRNLTSYPEPNCYNVEFDDDINDVISAQLLNIELPLKTYLINKYFNTLKIIIGSNNYNIKLNIGDYTTTDLSTEIKTQLNAALLGNTFDCQYIQLTDNFQILSNGPFSIDFTIKNSLAMLLGFKQTIYNSSTTIPTNLTYPYNIKSDFRKNFDYNNYVVMFIDHFDINKNQNNPLNKSFAIIGKDYNNLNISDDPMIIKYFSPPINKIAKMIITFYDRFNNLYDFQNIDHRFEILFKSHKQRRKYGSILQNHKI